MSVTFSCSARAEFYAGKKVRNFHLCSFHGVGTVHGIRVDRSDSAWTARGESFVIDSIITSPRPFQGHHEIRLKGQWVRGVQVLPPRSFIVSTAQAHGTLVVYLLEPESDDGFVTWNLFDSSLKKGGRFPVTRIFDLSRRGRGALRRSSTTITTPLEN